MFHATYGWGTALLTTWCGARPDADVQADRTGHFLFQLLDANQPAGTNGTVC